MQTRFNELIRARRQALGLTQADVAGQLGCQPEFITLIESGRRRAALDRVPEIAIVLQLDAGDLCRLALAERAPRFCAALFGPEPERRSELVVEPSAAASSVQ